MASKDVKYLAKDFDSFVSDFQNFTKVYFPSTYKDFSETSSGMMIIDLLANGSDVLRFYLDRRFNELLLDNAVEKSNIYSICRTLGYKPTKRAASLAELTIYLQVPATYSGDVPSPDYTYAPVVKKGSTALAGTIKFETLYDLDFTTATGSSDYAVARKNATTSKIEWYSLRKTTTAISGETKLKTFNVTDFTRFRKLTIEDEESLGIVDVLDTSGNRWYEVDYLTQNTVFEATVNTNSDSALVPYVLKLKKVPRRFVTEFDYSTGYLHMIFGSGKQDSSDAQLIPDTSELAIPLYGKTYFSSFALNPQNFLNTKTLGVAPYNTSLNVYYRAGGGASSVVNSGEISKPDKFIYEWKYSNLNANTQNSVVNSFAVSNANPSVGGRDEMTAYEIKQNAKAEKASQERAVTSEDYIVRLLSLPTMFGSFAKVAVKRNCKSINAVDILVLSYNAQGTFSNPTDTLINNARNYLSKYNLLTDNVFMHPAEIIDMFVKYTVVALPNSNRNTILSQCTNFIIQHFNKKLWSIGQPIVESEIVKGLQNVTGVYSVSNIDIKFSSSAIKKQNGIYYVPDDAIVQVANEQTDIGGVVL